MGGPPRREQSSVLPRREQSDLSAVNDSAVEVEIGVARVERRRLHNFQYTNRNSIHVKALKDDEVPHNPTKYGLALPIICTQYLDPHADDIPPVIFLKGAGEALFLTLLISWIITAIFNPSVIRDNPLKDRLGYNNLCVGWDEDPANKVAVVLWVFVAYLCIRFVTMNHLRFAMKEGKHFWYKIANLSFFIGVLCFALCLAIPPTVSVYWHTAPFIGYILTRFWVVLALCLDDWEFLANRSKMFLIVYGFISFTLPCIYIGEYIYFDKNGERSPWPWQITAALDYGWFFCLAITSKMIPSNILLRRNFELIEIDSSGRATKYTPVKQTEGQEESDGLQYGSNDPSVQQHY